MTTNNRRHPDILNPFAALIESGIEIRNALAESVTQLELAIEADTVARREARDYRQMYEEAEAEFLAEATFAADGKNAEQRKAQVDAALVQARRHREPLAGLWARMNNAAYAAEDAKAALEQCSKRFRATEAAADLTAAMLRAAMG